MKKAKNFLIYITSIGAQSFSTLLLLFIASRYLLDNQFVVFSVSISTSVICTALCFEPLRLFTIRNINNSEHEHNIERFFSSANISTFICFFASLVVSVFLKLEPIGAISFAAIAAFQGYSDFQQTVNRYKSSIVLYSFLQISRSVMVFALVSIVLALTRDSSIALASLSLAYFASIVLNSVFSKFSAQSFRVEAGFLWKVVSYGAPAAGAGLIYNSTLNFIKIFAINGAPSPSAASSYALAFDVAQKPLPLITTLFSTLLIPIFVKKYDQGGSDLSSKSETASKFEVIMASFLYISAITISAAWENIGLIQFIPAFDADFYAFGPAFLCLMCIFTFLQSSCAIMEQMERKTYISLFFSLISSLLTYITISFISRDSGVKYAIFFISIFLSSLILIRVFFNFHYFKYEMRTFIRIFTIYLSALCSMVIFVFLNCEFIYRSLFCMLCIFPLYVLFKNRRILFDSLES